VPKDGNGLNNYFSKVPKKARLEVDIVHVEDLDVTATPPPILPTPTIDPETELKFAMHETFHQLDLHYRLKTDLLEKCVEQGIAYHYLEDLNGKRKGQVMIVSDIWRMVDKFYHDWHQRDGTAMHNSGCFQADVQMIDRKRKKSTNAQKMMRLRRLAERLGSSKKQRCQSRNMS
jgi:hypothetical protein